MRSPRTVLGAVVGLVLAGLPASAAIATPVASGGPGVASYFDLARKDCVGTATGTTSKVWYTVAGGVLSDVYEPTIDNTDVNTLEYVVTDGATFTDLQTRDLTYTVSADPTGMACTVTATSAKHGYQLVTTYVTDPGRDTVLMHTELRNTHRGHTNLGALRLRLYARLDAHVNGNGGGGTDNGGADSGVVTRSGTPVVFDMSTVSQAANRDYAVPTYMALGSTSSGRATVGYVGTASDGLTSLDATHTLGTTYQNAPNGHIVAVSDVTPRDGHGVTLALGFGRTQSGALASAAVNRPFDAVVAQYEHGWQAYDRTLRRPPTSRFTAATTCRRTC